MFYYLITAIVFFFVGVLAHNFYINRALRKDADTRRATRSYTRHYRR